MRPNIAYDFSSPSSPSDLPQKCREPAGMCFALSGEAWMVQPLPPEPSPLPSHPPQVLACCSVFLLSLNATYFKHALLLTSYSKIKLLYNPFVDLSQFLLSFSMSIYDVHPDCTSFFFLSMFILKRSDKKKKRSIKKKSNTGGWWVFGQQLKTNLNGRGREGKRIQFLTKKNSKC